jgi:hypothetical protein
MTAKLTLQDRPGTVTVHNDHMIRAIVEGRAVYARTGENRQYRVRRPSPSPHIVKTVVFKASEVTSVNANGADLTDYASPVAYSAETVQVAA